MRVTDTRAEEIAHGATADDGSRFNSLTIAVLAVGLLVFAGVTDVAAQKRGGTIRVGMQGEPPTLDPHWTTAVNTEVIGGHIFEGLYTLDDTNQPIPMLAESHTVSRDGLAYTFKLRQGVPFHNGKELVGRGRRRLADAAGASSRSTARTSSARSRRSRPPTSTPSR